MWCQFGIDWAVQLEIPLVGITSQTRCIKYGKVLQGKGVLDEFFHKTVEGLNLTLLDELRIEGLLTRSYLAWPC